MAQQDRRINPDDLDTENGILLGCGALAHVSRTQHKPTNKWIALKTISKVQALQMKKVDAIKIEKQALYELGPHPGICFLHGTTQSDDELYFALDLIPNGDLLEHIRRVEGKRRKEGGDEAKLRLTPCLTFRDTRLIAAQLVNILAHVHRKGYCLRDLKPENICFHSNGRVVLIDFDTAMPCAPAPRPIDGHAEEDAPQQQQDNERRRKTISEIQAVRKMTQTFCGTAQYVSPEASTRCTWSIASDLFALGCVVYQMLTGRPPFEGKTSYYVMQKSILGAEGGLKNPLPPPIRDCAENAYVGSFIEALLHRDPVKRLGVVPTTSPSSSTSATSSSSFTLDVNAIRSHPFFADFNWEQEVDFDEDAIAAITDDSKFPPFGPRVPTLDGSLYQSGGGDADGRIRYDNAPVHSDDYAKYVYEAGDSLLERMAPSEDDHDEAVAAAEGEDVPPPQTAAVATASAVAGRSGEDEDDDDDTEDVIDDVGAQAAQYATRFGAGGEANAKCRIGDEE